MDNENSLDTNPQDSSQSTSGGSGQTENWERRFKGLQVAYDRLQKKYNDLEAAHAQVVSDLEEARQAQRGHDTEKKTLSDKVQLLETEKGTLQNQLTTHQFDVKRARMIMSDYQDLAPFEAKGLLPAAANEEELKQRLEDYRQTLTSLVGDGVQRRIAGQAPAGGGSPTGNTPSRSKDQVYNELVYLAGSQRPDDVKRYRDLMAEWDELNK